MRVSVRGGEDPPFYDLKGGCRCRASAPRKRENPVLFVCFVFFFPSLVDHRSSDSRTASSPASGESTYGKDARGAEPSRIETCTETSFGTETRSIRAPKHT